MREDLRGTYAGLASDAAIAYLESLGVTAVELDEVRLVGDVMDRQELDGRDAERDEVRDGGVGGEPRVRAPQILADVSFSFVNPLTCVS